MWFSLVPSPWLAARHFAREIQIREFKSREMLPQPHPLKSEPKQAETKINKQTKCRPDSGTNAMRLGSNISGTVQNVIFRIRNHFAN